MSMITIDTDEVLLDRAIKLEYEPYSLVPEDDPILKQEAALFRFDEDINAQELSIRLIETLRKHRAYGLAAPQCGIPYKVFVMGFGEEYITMFNPEIIYTSEKTVHLEEGCLSFPFMILSITRPKEIKVKFSNESGEIQEMFLDGISARVAQHEIDHLNGITFNTLAKPLALKSGLKKREKYVKRFAINTAIKQTIGQRAS
jgi:peptide deformylase